MIQMIGLWISLLFMHPLHLGVIHFNVDDHNGADIEVRLFTDDLEAAITHRVNQSFKLNYNDDISLKLVEDYLDQTFNVYNDENQIKLKLLKIKPLKDVTVIKYSAILDEGASLKVCCEVFYELFRDQTNLVIVKTNDIEDGYRLDQLKSCVRVEN